jgi:hypothetical protein
MKLKIWVNLGIFQRLRCLPYRERIVFKVFWLEWPTLLAWAIFHFQPSSPVANYMANIFFASKLARQCAQMHLEYVLVVAKYLRHSTHYNPQVK